MGPPPSPVAPPSSLSPTSPSHLASGVSKTQAFFPGCCSPHPGSPPPRASVTPVAVVGVVLGSQVVQRGPHTLSQGAPLCLLPRPTAPHVASSCFHAAPVNLSQEELAGTELMGPVWKGCQITRRAQGPLGTHRDSHVCRAHRKVGQRPQLGPQAASQSWPGPSKEMQLAPKENDGCEQLPSWPGASLPDVPESSRCLGTLVEVDAAESIQLPT